MTETETLSMIRTQQYELLEQMQEVVRMVAQRRKVPTSHVRELHAYTAASRRNALCPCCEDQTIVNDDAELTGEIDHWYAVSRSGPEETWPVCRACNLRLTKPSFKATKTAQFHAYQFSLRTAIVMQDGQCKLFGYEEAA